MPTAARSRAVDVSRLRRIPHMPPIAAPVHMPPIETHHLTQSPVMISSLPSISTQVDGITRQFYGASGNVPMRRVLLP